MKTNRFLLSPMIVVAIVALTFSSCRRETEDNDTNTAGDNAFAESAFNDVTNISDEAGYTGTLSNYRLANSEGIIASSCATITFDSANTANQDTIHINFGTTDCTCNDGRTRRGEIIVFYSGRYRDSASTHTITFNDYYVNDNHVMGTKTVVNNGHNAAGHLVYTITVTDGRIDLANNGGTIYWNSTRQREWTSGESTMIWSDDVYSITGTASGEGTDGHHFDVLITSPLIRNMTLGCRRHFVQGTLKLTPDNKPERIVDFGSGACDDIATVTINNHVYTIHLR
ncbi:MAG TPA: hypothetical protein VL651_06180 [Bacteroidia bacterium]|jgi:hypothetical protein|nr:hypothetical protein [Bacteroidia bacterium]